MRTEREATRIVESWLEHGSTAIPDRVLDVVLSDLPSMPQRRSRWLPWRFRHMSSVLRLGAVAAVVAAAVLVGIRILPVAPSDSSPGVGASRSLPPDGFGGGITIPYLDSTASIDVLGTFSGSKLTGTALFRHRQGDMAIQLACMRRDGDHWILGGTVASTTIDEPPIGSPAAVLVVSGPQQQAVVWSPVIRPNGTELEYRPTTGAQPSASPGTTCESFVAGLSLDAFGETAPVQDGALVLPAGS